MTRGLKVLVLGGYGTFGGRLVKLLADEARLTLVVAGRSRIKAAAFCEATSSRAKMLALVFDRDGDVESQLRDAAPDIVIDASGPFQFYTDPYRVVRAALMLGVHYLDLADGTDFVQGITRFDAEAKARGVFVLSGASTCPVLTAAVVRRLSAGMPRVQAVTGGIAPSPYAGIGLNVIRAVASYAGQPLDTGPAGRRHALVDTLRHTIAPPGRLPLHSIRYSLVDVPDLKVLPTLWPDLRSVWMGVGPRPATLHRALNMCAWLVRAGLLPSLAPLAPLMHRIINVLRWGEHRGGMFVSVEGAGPDGAPVERSWHMIAEGDDGPFVPAMAAEAIVRRHLGGTSAAAGARPATNDVDLSDYEASFARRAIVTGIRDAVPSSAPLYRRVLGSAWDSLPEPLRVMHDVGGLLRAEGVAATIRGPGLVARLIAAAFRFPPSGRHVPVKVSFEVRDGRETWRREFAGHAFASSQEEGRGRFERLLCERFGPFAFGLALVIADGRMRLVVRRWSLFGLPLPLRLAPYGDAFESAENARFNFHVEIGHPLVGLIVRYDGWLIPCS